MLRLVIRLSESECICTISLGDARGAHGEARLGHRSREPRVQREGA